MHAFLSDVTGDKDGKYLKRLGSLVCLWSSSHKANWARINKMREELWPLAGDRIALLRDKKLSSKALDLSRFTSLTDNIQIKMYTGNVLAAA